VEDLGGKRTCRDLDAGRVVVKDELVLVPVADDVTRTPVLRAR
jgi:hypothetical protein